MKLTHTQAVWGMVAVAAMWSIAGVVTRQLESAARFEITFWRSLFTMLSLLVILPLWKGRGALRSLPWRNRLFWISGLCWSVMFTAFMVALTLTTVANVLITLALGPLITAIMARVFIGHALPARTWGAIGVAGLNCEHTKLCILSHIDHVEHRSYCRCYKTFRAGYPFLCYCHINSPI